MALRSPLFQGDAKLDAAAVSDPAHITPGARGDHVRKIQLALIQLDSANIDADGSYGPKTAAAVLAYKQKRGIINRSYQTQADNITGKMTLAAMDEELIRTAPPPPPPPAPIRPSNRLLLNFKFDALLIDIFIKIQGFGSPQKQGLHDPVESALFSANTMANPAYDSTKRFMTAFVFTGSLDARNPSQVIIDAVKLINQSAEGDIDRVFLWGGSAGGKNILSVANALADTVGDAMQYIGVSDAAFDENDPVMRNPGNIKAKIRKNWFQTFGQTIDPRKEFHGPLPGFQNFDMTGSPDVQTAKRNFESLGPIDRRLGSNQAKAADAAHTAAFAEGLSVGLGDIRRMILGPKI
jgi:peptidoglycan hydrolase-like protein with peptidoglycan-binding domain